MLVYNGTGKERSSIFSKDSSHDQHPLLRRQPAHPALDALRIGGFDLPGPTVQFVTLVQCAVQGRIGRLIRRADHGFRRHLALGAVCQRNLPRPDPAEPGHGGRYDRRAAPHH